MKKVLCLIDGLGQGGAERQMVGLAHYLQERGYAVTLASYHGKNFYADLIREYGLRHVFLEGLDNPWQKFTRIGSFIKKNRFDCVIAYKNGTTLLASLIRCFYGPFRLIVSERNASQRLTFRERIKFISYRAADYVVPNSHTQKCFIDEHFSWLRKKNVCITNFTDTEYFRPAASRVDNPVFTVVVAARFAPQKNQLLFLDALDIVRKRGVPLKIKWFGNISAGEESYKEQCLKKVQESGLEEYIAFYPASNQILDEYQHCDAFCLPSVYEGFPNVICEAMSCGKPVLCSRICDNPYLVEDGRNGLMFDPTDPEDIADALCKAVSMSKEDLRSMGDAGRTMAVGQLSEEAFIDKYIRLIENGNEE